MNLTPREKDKLLIAMAAVVARKRLERGVKLNHPEAIALITDFDHTAVVRDHVFSPGALLIGGRDHDSLADQMGRRLSSFLDSADTLAANRRG